MASTYRSAVMAAARTVAIRSKLALPIPLPSRRASNIVCRPLSSAFGCLESLTPLHSAIASARLVSNIAVDASCWSRVSQGSMSTWYTNQMLINSIRRHSDTLDFAVPR